MNMQCFMKYTGLKLDPHCDGDFLPLSGAKHQLAQHRLQIF